MYFIKTYLKSEGQKKVKVNDTEYQGQMKEIFCLLQIFLWAMCYADGTPLTEKHSCGWGIFVLEKTLMPTLSTLSA